MIIPKKYNHKYFFIFLSIGLILLAGFRSPTPDYENYVRIFYNVQTKQIEPAMVIISSILHLITNNSIVLFVFIAFFGVTFKLIAIKQLSKLWFLSISIYISYYYMYHELIQIRTGIATGLLLLSIKPIYDRDLKRFLIYTIIAISFHISALMVLPLWFLSINRFNKYMFYAMIIVSYLLIVNGINISYIVGMIPIEEVRVRFEGYMHRTNKGGETNYLNVFSVLQLMRVMLSFTFIYFSNIIYKHNKYAYLLIQIYVLSVVSYVIFSTLPVLAVRVSQFLGIVEIVLIPSIIYIFNTRTREVSKLIPLAIAFFTLSLTLFYRQLI